MKLLAGLIVDIEQRNRASIRSLFYELCGLAIDSAFLLKVIGAAIFAPHSSMLRQDRSHPEKVVLGCS